MPVKSFLHEIAQLKKVSASIDALADQHPASEEALLAISGSIRNSTALLEVIVETRIANRPE